MEEGLYILRCWRFLTAKLFLFLFLFPAANVRCIAFVPSMHHLMPHVQSRQGGTGAVVCTCEMLVSRAGFDDLIGAYSLECVFDFVSLLWMRCVEGLESVEDT